MTDPSAHDALYIGVINLELARKVLDEYVALCAQDNGALWGLSLLGPMILVDPDSRYAVASHADAEGQLVWQGGLFAGRIPPHIGIANTAITWAGIHWTMIMWPSISQDRQERMRLMAHEAFHRIQEQIGLAPLACTNSHLDTAEGRLWLQLEWRALARALQSFGQERGYAIEDALIFREYRRTCFPGAAAEERALEMHEGLAEYTGVKLSGTSTLALAHRLLHRPAELGSLVRSFAYLSGPAYGLLLDETRIHWRKDLTPQYDLGILAEQYYGINLPSDSRDAAEHRSSLYDSETLREAEEKRELERQAQLAAYRARLVEGPVLILPLSERTMGGYDPNEVIPCDDEGTVHPSLWLSDDWGVLSVTSGGALLNWTARTVRVPVPSRLEARPLTGDGWTLELREGWILEPAIRPGDHTLIREEKK